MRGIRGWLAGLAGSSSVAVAVLAAGQLGLILAGGIAAFIVIVAAVVVLSGIYGRGDVTKRNARQVLCIRLGRDPPGAADAPERRQAPAGQRPVAQ
jgi:hypothetical protein